MSLANEATQEVASLASFFFTLYYKFNYKKFKKVLYNKYINILYWKSKQKVIYQKASLLIGKEKEGGKFKWEEQMPK